MTLPRILTAVPRLPHVHLEIAKAIRTLTAMEEKRQLAPQAEATASERDRDLIKRCVDEISREVLPLFRSFLAERRLAKAAVDDPKHPGWPAHSPDSEGGRFRPKDAAVDSSPSSSADDRQNAPERDVRVAMEPWIDPGTGGSFAGETPFDRLGGGEGPGGGGVPGRSSGGSSEAAAAGAESAGPRQIGGFVPPDNLTYGTTLYGSYAHGQIGDLLKELYPGVKFILRVRLGQRGIDVEVPNESVGEVGYRFGEIKPRTSSGEAAFNRQLQEWGVGPVQSITYDAAGNVYYGFR